MCAAFHYNSFAIYEYTSSSAVNLIAYCLVATATMFISLSLGVLIFVVVRKAKQRWSPVEQQWFCTGAHTTCRRWRRIHLLFTDFICVSIWSIVQQSSRFDFNVIYTLATQHGRRTTHTHTQSQTQPRLQSTQNVRHLAILDNSMLRYHHQCVLRLPIGILGTEMICTMPRIQHTIAIIFKNGLAFAESEWIRSCRCVLCVCVRSCCVCLRTCVLRYYCVSTDYAVFFFIKHLLNP